MFRENVGPEESDDLAARGEVSARLGRPWLALLLHDLARPQASRRRSLSLVVRRIKFLFFVVFGIVWLPGKFWGIFLVVYWRLRAIIMSQLEKLKVPILTLHVQVSNFKVFWWLDCLYFKIPLFLKGGSGGEEKLVDCA